MNAAAAAVTAVIEDSPDLSQFLTFVCAGEEYGVGILVSDNVVDAVPSYLYREIDKVQVKGRLEGVAIFEPIGRLDQVEESRIEPIDQFNRMLDHYRAQRWDEAAECFRKVLALNPRDKPSKVYIERAQHFAADPPGAAAFDAQ